MVQTKSTTPTTTTSTQQNITSNSRDPPASNADTLQLPTFETSDELQEAYMKEYGEDLRATLARSMEILDKLQSLELSFSSTEQGLPAQHPQLQTGIPSAISPTHPPSLAPSPAPTKPITTQPRATSIFGRSADLMKKMMDSSSQTTKQTPTNKSAPYVQT